MSTEPIEPTTFLCPNCGQGITLRGHFEHPAAAELDVAALAEVFGKHPIHWDVKRNEGTATRYVMTRIFDSPDEAAAYIAAAYREARGEIGVEAPPKEPK